MGVSFEEFANELRAFDQKKEIVNEMRRDFRKALPPFRTRVRASAIAMLPARGGLGQWVAKAAITFRLKDSGRAAGFKIRMSRRSGKGKAELEKLDEQGEVRHPLYGNRGHWFRQQVAAWFFTTAWDQGHWTKLADDAMDRALDKIRKG